MRIDIYFPSPADEQKKGMTGETALQHENQHAAYFRDEVKNINKLINGIGAKCYYCQPCKGLRNSVVSTGIAMYAAIYKYQNDLLDYRDYWPGPDKDEKKSDVAADVPAVNAAKAAYMNAVNAYNKRCK